MYLERLQQKWGEFKVTENYLEQCPMPFVSEQARLNVIFNPEEEKVINNVFEKLIKAKILPELKQFYKKCNGCRLFFGSLSIFGIQRHPKDVYEPFDVFQENKRLLAQMNVYDREKCKYVFIGSLGGDYVFAYEPTELRTIYCMEAGKIDVIKTYNCFKEFFDCFFNVLIDEYDKDGHKIHINKIYNGIPALENITCDINLFDNI